MSVAAAIAGAALLWGAPAGAAEEGRRPKRLIEADLKFAAEMASQGLWREALFRWERVSAERPDDARLLNNIAVAHEALGEFDQARAAYARAIAIAKERQILSTHDLFQRAHAPPPSPEAASSTGAKP